MALQADWVGEQSRVPGEIPLLISVVNIEPDNVVWNIVAIETSIDSLHVGFIVVVKATLVVPKCKQWG